MKKAAFIALIIVSGLLLLVYIINPFKGPATNENKITEEQPQVTSQTDKEEGFFGSVADLLKGGKRYLYI